MFSFAATGVSVFHSIAVCLLLSLLMCHFLYG